MLTILTAAALAASPTDAPSSVYTNLDLKRCTLLERGTDIRVIQALLGHDKLDTTARYTRVATGMIANVESPLRLHSRYGPSDRSVAQGDLCREAPTQPVTRPSRSPAFGPIDNCPGEIIPH